MIETSRRLKIKISKSWAEQGIAIAKKKKKPNQVYFSNEKNDGRALNPLNIQIFIC